MNLLPNKRDAYPKPITETRISASEWNQLVGSCMAFITEAGFTPDASDNEQFLNAFKAIAASLELIGANTNLSNLTPTGEAKFNAKVDLDGSNATFAHIVETYSNGTDWYRVWSDGWCEQGGIKSVNYNNTTTNVSLLKQYIDTNYNILLSLGGYVANGVAQCSWQNKTVSSFDIYGDYSQTTGGTIDTYWEAKGYIS